jgi:hypothetical protein
MLHCGVGRDLPANVSHVSQVKHLTFFGLFRRRPPIQDAGQLADFVDEQAAFLAQKGIYEYSRARAGHYAKVLFREEAFTTAIEQSRWRAYPMALAMVGEVTDAVLRPFAGADRQPYLDALVELVLSVFDRYPVPAALGSTEWRDARVELLRRLQLIGVHPPKRAKDIPNVFAEAYFNLMPIHEELRRADFPTLRNYLRVTLCNIHDELSNRVDAPVLMNALQPH